jgi:hypothetical protein
MIRCFYSQEGGLIARTQLMSGVGPPEPNVWERGVRKYTDRDRECPDVVPCSRFNQLLGRKGVVLLSFEMFLNGIYTAVPPPTSLRFPREEPVLAGGVSDSAGYRNGIVPLCMSRPVRAFGGELLAIYSEAAEAGGQYWTLNRISCAISKSMLLPQLRHNLLLQRSLHLF